MGNLRSWLQSAMSDATGKEQRFSVFFCFSVAFLFGMIMVGFSIWDDYGRF